MLILNFLKIVYRLTLKTFCSVKNERNNELKRAIELKNLMQAIIKKCVDMKLPLEQAPPKTLAAKRAAPTSSAEQDTAPCASKTATEVEVVSDDAQKSAEAKRQRRDELLKVCQASQRFIGIFKRMNEIS